jgi:hypothetical protein
VYAGTVDLEAARGADHSGIYPDGAGLTAEDLGLDAFEPHAQQGWHLRLEVDGPKHKMFWVDCPVDGVEAQETDQQPASDEVDGDAVEQDATDQDDEAFGIGGGDDADDTVLRLLLEDEERVHTSSRAERAAGAGDVEVLGVAADEQASGIGGAEPSGDEQVLAAGGEGGERALPVTGANLLWLAAVAIALGGLGLRLVTHGRRAALDARG